MTQPFFQCPHCLPTICRDAFNGHDNTKHDPFIEVVLRSVADESQNNYLLLIICLHTFPTTAFDKINAIWIIDRSVWMTSSASQQIMQIYPCLRYIPSAHWCIWYQPSSQIRRSYRSVLSSAQCVVFFLQHIVYRFILRCYAKMIELDEHFRNLANSCPNSSCIYWLMPGKTKTFTSVVFFLSTFVGKQADWKELIESYPKLAISSASNGYFLWYTTPCLHLWNKIHHKHTPLLPSGVICSNVVCVCLHVCGAASI